VQKETDTLATGGLSWRLMASREDFLPYRQLAMRVLSRAFDDLLSPGGSTADRESAREFLSGSSMLCLWCGLAAIDPRSVVERAHRLSSAYDTHAGISGQS
jgi:hypothetical protein